MASRRGLPEVRSQSHDRSIGELAHHVIEGRMIFDTPYQRGEVWSLGRKVNLWKSLLMHLPVGAIFLNFRGYHDPVDYVVDGQQRLRALGEFFSDGYALPGEWFPSTWIAESARNEPLVMHSDLSTTGRNKIRLGLPPVAVYTTMLATVEEEAELYLLINFGGVPQTDEDRARATRLITREGRDDD